MKLKDFLLIGISASLVIAALAAATKAQWADDGRPKANLQQSPATTQQADQQDSQQPMQSRRKFKIKLTLTQTSDLQVAEGDRVKAGQVIADRRQQRQQLEAQRVQLHMGLKQLETPAAKALPINPVPTLAQLPARSFTSELVNIDEQHLKLKGARQAQLDQLQKLAALRTIEGLPKDVWEHERAKTEQIDRSYQLQVQQVRKAEAQLEAAKRDQARAEYLYQLEKSRRAIAIQRQELERNAQRQRHTDAERDRAFKQSSIRQKIVEIDQKLAELAVVTSPYDAKVHRVKFLEQNDNSLIATVVLHIDRNTSNSQQQPEQQSDQQNKWTEETSSSDSSEASSTDSSADSSTTNRWN